MKTVGFFSMYEIRTSFPILNIVVNYLKIILYMWDLSVNFTYNMHIGLMCDLFLNLYFFYIIDYRIRLK